MNAVKVVVRCLFIIYFPVLLLTVTLSAASNSLWLYKYDFSKYNISRTFRVIMDLMTIRLLMQHLHNPLGFFGKFSIFSGMAGTVTFFLALAQLTFTPIDVGAFNISISMTVLLWAASLMFMNLGLVGKMIVGHGERRSFSLEE